MSREAAFISALRGAATHPAARGLLDDAAVLPAGDGDLVLTHDMLVEGVHFLPADPPADVAWKLVAVNLSDLAAKGAAPLGVLAGCGLGADDGWDMAFAAGLADALAMLDTPLLGGDTVRMPADAPRTLGLTAIGRAPTAGAPSRTGARAGDDMWVTGWIGDAGAGLAIAQGKAGPEALRARYRRPTPRLAAGAALAPLVHAMSDVSDGLLIDAGRMAAASGLAITVALEAVPLSDDLIAWDGAGRQARLTAATAGDDYELLFAASPMAAGAITAAGRAHGLPVTRVGRFAAGCGLTLTDDGAVVPLPARLGYEHG